MTSPLSDALAAQLDGEPLQKIARQLGIAPAQATAAIGAALPLLLGALGRNASQPQGAQALYGALEHDHAGLDIGNVLSTVLGGGGQGSQILGHVFGDRQPRAGAVLGQSTGLGTDKAAMLLRWLAPVVMAYLAQRMSSQASQGPSPNAGTVSPPQVLGDVLGHEATQSQGGLLGAVLDRDGDGEVDLDELLKLGGSVLGAS